jgi:cytochrome c oxidase subunit II
MKRLNIQAISIAILVISFLIQTILLASCSSPYDRSYSFKSNGERIYFTATSSSGDIIDYTGGIGMMNQQISCASCHGSKGKGGSVKIMMSQLDVPDITWDKLKGEFTEQTVKLAITQGIDPDGTLMDTEMPRWRMSDRDMDDLVNFLKTLN